MNHDTQTIEFPADIAPDVLRSPFLLTLCRLRGGDAMRELDDDFNQVVKSSQMTGKKATLTIKIDTKPNGTGKILLADTSSKKLPRPEQGTTALFSTPQGQLLPYDPDQLELKFKTLAFKDPEVRKQEDLTPRVKAAGQ